MIDIIPAIDIIDGKCVRLSQGDYNNQKVYSNSPLDVAKKFEDYGLRRLHLVDLDGAKSKHIVNYRTLEQIAAHTSLTIDFGGGIKTEKDLAIALECGAQMVTVGSIAASNSALFEEWLQKFGPQKIILGADAKDEKIAVNGWLEGSNLQLLPYLELYYGKGITQVLCTDIRLDGMLQGPSTDLYKKIMQQIPSLYLIASGGVSSMNDIRNLDAAGIPAVVTGKAIYENRITLKEIQNFIEEKR